MMVSPRPNMKPTWTPAAMNRDTKPIRSHPSTISTAPTSMVRAAERAAKRSGSPRASGATIAAEMAAVEEVGLTISWRQVPNRA
jgi:hypothetical protein